MILTTGIYKKASVLILCLFTILMAFALTSCDIEVDRDAPESGLNTSNPGVIGDDNLGFTESVFQGEPLNAPSDVAKELRIIWEAWAILTKDHVDRAELDPKTMSEAAIRGMLIALGDPHTNYVPPEAFAIDSNDIFQGEFEGIGAHVSMNRNGVLIIVAPIQGSPAEKAGIRPGDQILAVDGASLEGFTVLQAVSLIRGPKGSTVKLLVKHLGALDPVEVEIVRGTIPLVSVLVRSLPEDPVAHLRITNFHDNTAGELVSALDKAIANGADGLILDVRDNPGGLLSAAIDVTSQFLEKGLVLYEVDGDGMRRNFNVKGGGIATKIPLVVLTNGGSASASEILAGAVQDYERGLVIGSTTFGKGTVNTFRRLGNGAGLYMSVARYYTPAGRVIEDVGVVPDIEVSSRDRQSADTDQVNRAMEELKKQISDLPQGN